MNIREANPADIPEIVKVLKASLGEELPVSEVTWTYKHVNNPFGASIVLLAEEDGDIIGVRAFMRWQLSLGEQVLHTYRAVDTATHPDHRGKGIFKKLTLKAVDIAKERGHHFIFNFPNDQSRPGYLKMGWQKSGKLKVALKPAFSSFWKFYKRSAGHSIEYDATEEEIQNLCAVWNSKLKDAGLITPKSYTYLIWRFGNNPLQEYSVYANSDFYISASVKKRKGVQELRITECIFKEDKQTRKEMRKLIRQWCSRFGVQVISFSPDLLHLGSLNLKGAFGPILTVRELNLREEEKARFFNLNNWTYSLGDLELF